MTAMSIEALLVPHRKFTLPLSSSAVPVALRRNGSRGFSRAVAALRMRMWMPLMAALLACPGAWAQNGVFTTPQPVGLASAAQTVTVTAQAAGTVATVEVLTMGAPNLDFTIGAGTSTCTEGASFTVSCAELRLPRPVCARARWLFWTAVTTSWA